MLWVMALWAGLNGPAAAAPPAELVQVQLLADVGAIQPGRPFTAGVLYRIKPDWHVYWKNPGDAGLPTALRFQLPQGFSVSETLYPLPIQFSQPGEVVGYGYQQSVMLLATITPPEKLDSTAPVRIEVTTAWLCCKDICVPGRAKLEMALPVAADAEPVNREVFEHWRGQLPVMPEEAAGVKIEKAQVSAAGPARVNAELLVTIAPAPRSVEFFPITPEALSLNDVALKQQGGQVRVQFAAHALEGQKLEEKSLPAILVWIDPNGNRRGVRVEFPLMTVK